MTRYEIIGQYKPVADIDPKLLEAILWAMDDFAKQMAVDFFGEEENIFEVEKYPSPEEIAADYDNFRKEQNV